MKACCHSGLCILCLKTICNRLGVVMDACKLLRRLRWCQQCENRHMEQGTIRGKTFYFVSWRSGKVVSLGRMCLFENCGLAKGWYREWVSAGRVMGPGIIGKQQITYMMRCWMFLLIDNGFCIYLKAWTSSCKWQQNVDW